LSTRLAAVLAALGAVLAVLVAGGGPAQAHRTNLATALVTVTGDEVHYRLSVSAHDLAVALGIATDLKTPLPASAFETRGAALDAYLGRSLRVAAAGAPCRLAPPTIDYSGLPQDVALELVYRCPAPVERLSIAYGLFFDIDPQHRSIGRLVLTDRAEEFLFDRSLNRLDVEVGSAVPSIAPAERFLRVLLIGVEHILGGYDHLLFLAALLIGSVRFWGLVKIVTAFTVAHSLTLSLAWYGAVDLPARLVEILIALSIAYVAVENIVGKGLARRWLVTFFLGLVHGLGFYGALRDLDLARGDAVTTVLAFNLGVEAGQIAVIAVVFLAIAWWARQSWFPATARAGSAAILAVAAYWVVERAFLA
jgi:hypothetical protein